MAKKRKKFLTEERKSSWQHTKKKNREDDRTETSVDTGNGQARIASVSEKEVREHYRLLTLELIRKHMTITTMESATSGQIASLITDTEGASSILKGAFVTYSNEAKIMQGVPKEIIERHTVYSAETAFMMAYACRDAYNADIGIGVTGTMGNIDPANSEASEPGQVYFSIVMRENDLTRANTYHITVSPQPTRLMYKLAVAEEIYRRLIDSVRKTPASAAVRGI